MCLLTETLTGSDRNNLSCDHHPLFCLCFFFSLQVTWWFGRWFWEEWVQMFVVAHQMVQHYPHSSLRVWLSWTQCTDWLIFAWLDEEKVRKFFVDRTCGTKSVSVQFPDDCKWLFTLLWLLLIEIFLPLLLIQQKIFNLMLTSLCFIIYNLWLSSCLFLASWFFFFPSCHLFFSRHLFFTEVWRFSQWEDDACKPGTVMQWFNRGRLYYNKQPQVGILFHFASLDQMEKDNSV